MTTANIFCLGFKNAAIKTVKYGYFSPLQALYLTITRGGSYSLHFKALYRLCFGVNYLRK